ncbi:hypothetical protein Ancab_039490 [Ancistrocladus abbreviatus]
MTSYRPHSLGRNKERIENAQLVGRMLSECPGKKEDSDATSSLAFKRKASISWTSHLIPAKRAPKRNETIGKLLPPHPLQSKRLIELQQKKKWFFSKGMFRVLSPYSGLSVGWAMELIAKTASEMKRYKRVADYFTKWAKAIPKRNPRNEMRTSQMCTGLGYQKALSLTEGRLPVFEIEKGQLQQGRSCMIYSVEKPFLIRRRIC